MRRLLIALFIFLVTCSAISMEYEREDTIVIDSSGNARISRIESVPSSALASLYRIHWEYIEELADERDFFSQASTELKFLLPGELVWNSAQLGPEADSFSRSLEGRINAFSIRGSDDDLWTIETGPSEKLMEEYFEFIFSQMMFQTMFLEALEKPSKEFQGQSNDGVIDHRKITRIVLPEGAEIINEDELDRMDWLVDFGGGSVMSASLAVLDNTLVLTEQLHISLSRPGEFLDHRGAFIMSLYNYARFDAKYRIPERRASLSNSLCKEPGPDDWAGNFYQNFSGLELSAEVEIPLGGTTSSATPACTIGLTVKPSAPLNAHIAWDIDFYWDWWDSSWELDYFEAWINASPQLELTVEFEAELTFAEIEKTLLSKSYPVARIAFSIGVVPVYINIVLYGELKAKAKAYGKLTAETGVVVGVNLKAGARYSDGWSDIVEFDPFYTIKPLEIDAEAGATATGKLEVGAHALLYDIAGPYIAVIPSLEAGLKVSVSEGLEPVLMARLSAAAGIDIAGWLKSIIGDIGSVTIEIGDTLEKDLIAEIGDLLDWNQPPSADAGTDFSANEGEVVSLDGVNSSDPDSDSLSYTWAQISGSSVQVQNPNARVATFTAPELPKDSVSQLEFKLEISDGRGGSSSDTIKVTVLDVNKQPSSNMIDQIVDEGSTLTVDLNSYVSDPDGDTVTLTKTSGPGEITNGIYIFSPNFTESGSYTVEFSVSDGRGGSIVDQFTVVVNNVNRPPVASVSPVQAGSFSEGSEVEFDGSASSDPDGDQLIYSWSVTPSFSLENTGASQVSLTAPEQLPGQNTVYTVTLEVRDGGSLTSSATAAFTSLDINNPPIANAGCDQSVEEGSTVTIDGSASEDPDFGDQLAYTWILPEGIEADNTSEPTLSFIAPDVPWGTEELYVFTLAVTDILGATASDTVTVTVNFVNAPPVADAGPDKESGAYYPVSFTVGESYDPDEGDSLTQYKWDFGDGTSTEWREISEEGLTHVYAEYGICNPVLSVRDTMGATASDSFSLEVRELVIQMNSEDDILEFEAADGVMHNYDLGEILDVETISCTFSGRDIIQENPFNPKENQRSSFSGVAILISMDGFNWTSAGSLHSSPASVAVESSARYLRIVPSGGRLTSSILDITYRGSDKESLSNVQCYSSSIRTRTLKTQNHNYTLSDETIVLEYEVEIAGSPGSLQDFINSYSYSILFERPGIGPLREAEGSVSVFRSLGDQAAYHRGRLFELVDSITIGEFASTGFSKICFSFAEPIEISPPESIDSSIENEYGDWYFIDGSEIADMSLRVSSFDRSELIVKIMSSNGSIFESVELDNQLERHYVDSLEGNLYIGIMPANPSDMAEYVLHLSSRDTPDLQGGDNMQNAVPLGSSRSVSGELSQKSPENWYKLAPDCGQIIDLSLQVPEDARFVLQLKNPSGITRKSVSGSGETVYVDHVAGVSGEWFVRVYRSSGTGTYNLTSTISNQNDSGSQTDSGDSTSTSVPLLPGQYTGLLKLDDNEDMYAVEIEKGQIIHARLSTESAGRFYVSFKKENGSILGGSSCSKGSPGLIDYCTDFTGPIYVRASRSSGEGLYELDVSVRDQDDAGSGEDAGEQIESSIAIQPGAISGELKHSDDTDFYSVEATKGQIIYAQLSTESDGKFHVSFKKENGSVIGGSSCSKGSPGLIDYCIDYTGPIYVRVSRSSGEGLYELSVVVSDQNDADSGEDAGETPEDGTQITMGSVSGTLKLADNEDWFVFSAVSGEIISLESDPAEGLTYHLSLKYSSRDSLMTADSVTVGTDANGIVFCTKNTGNHYIRVSRSSGEGDYSFSLQKIQQDDASSGGDAGDSLSESTPLPVVTQFAATYTGYLLSRDDNDWYALTALPAGVLNIVLNNSDGRFYLYLYNASGNQVAYSNNYGGEQTISHSVASEGGLWYLRVIRNHGGGDYSLTISREPLVQVP